MSAPAARRPVILDEILQVVCDLHAELAASGLVAWTSGNISARVPG